MKLTAVIPTKNEGKNIRACVASFLPAIREGWGEVIVVDNASDDDTAAQARAPGVRVIQKGPERSAQRNEGWRQARGEYVFFVDADMRVPIETLRELQAKMEASAADAFFVREERVGGGWWTRARNFERSFYDATRIDALRVIRRGLLEKVDGYDERMHACEDWDLDRRISQLSPRVALTDGCLLHDERRLTFRRHVQKKAYYSGNFSHYLDKWGRDAVTRQQFGPVHRFFGVFFENGKWRRALSRPHYMFMIWLERACVGMVYLARKRGPRT